MAIRVTEGDAHAALHGLPDHLRGTGKLWSDGDQPEIGVRGSVIAVEHFERRILDRSGRVNTATHFADPWALHVNAKRRRHCALRGPVLDLFGEAFNRCEESGTFGRDGGCEKGSDSTASKESGHLL